MLWNMKTMYDDFPFTSETEFEKAILECKDELFGENRFYFDIKKKIGKKGKVNNIPDGYLLDLSNSKFPKIFVVENEISTHHSIKHIAVQLLEFSLSYESSKLKVKNIIRDEIMGDTELHKKISKFAQTNKYDNIDYLLESVIIDDDSFNVLLIIDEMNEDLEIILNDKLNFPIDVKTIRRFKSNQSDIIYEFTPFDRYEYNDVNNDVTVDIDTLVVPAHEDGFNEVFLGEDCWYSVRLSKHMLPRLRYIATYQVAPVSAITHVAEIESISKYENTSKYIIYFKSPAYKINPIPLGTKKGTAPQNIRYTSKLLLDGANNLDDIF